MLHKLSVIFLAVVAAVSVPLQSFAMDRIYLADKTPLAGQLTKADAIYVVTSQFDLQGSAVNMPANSVLSFQGGKFVNGTIKGNGTCIDAPLYHILGADIILSGIWKVKAFYPEWFGASGDGVNDDTKAIRATISNAFNNHVQVELPSPYYLVKGDNPFGLDRYAKESDISFYMKEGVTGDNNRGRYNLYIDGKGSLIYWEPSNNDEVFAFVGYLRSSVWENMTIVCKGTKRNMCDVFSTRFNTSNQSHVFSGNIFRNISVNGGCRRVFNFDCASTEKQTHDDLSVFEKINASGFDCFCYICNGNSVSNSFMDCNLVLNKDNCSAFFINCDSWAGGMRIQNSHITMMNCSGPVIIKDKTKNIQDRIIYLEKPRVEIISSASNWRYFELNGITLFMDGLESITDPGYQSNHAYGVLTSGNAHVSVSNVSNLFQPFSVSSSDVTSFRSNISFNDCSFRVGSDRKDVSESPVIWYSSGSKTYTSRPEALLSGNSFPNIEVNNSRSGISDGRRGMGYWNDDYILYNSIQYADANVKTRVLMNRRTSAINSYNIVDRNASYSIPRDIVCVGIQYISDNYSSIGKIQLICNGKVAYEFRNVQDFQKCCICLPSSSSVKFKFFNKSNVEHAETEMGVKESCMKIEYREPSGRGELMKFVAKQ